MLEMSIIIALIVLVIHASMWEGMIFEKVGVILYTLLPDFLHNPVYKCVICMTPWYACVICLLLQRFSTVHHTTFTYVAIILAATGINVLTDIMISAHDNGK